MTNPEVSPRVIVGVWADVRVILMTTVMFTAVISPTTALRTGAVLCVPVVVIGIAGFYRLRTADGLAVAYAVFAGLSLLWSEAPANSLNSFLNATACSTIFVAIRITTARKRDYKTLSFAMIAGSLVSIWIMVSTGGQLRWAYNESDIRIGLDGLNLNYTAYSLVTSAVVVVGLLVGDQMHGNRERGILIRRIILIILFMTMYLGVVLNGTRGALLAFGLLALWWLVYRIRPSMTYSVLAAVFFLMNLVMLTGWLDRLLSRQVTVNSRDVGDLNGRLTIWPIARRHFWDSPLVGHGVGSFPGYSKNPWGIGAHSAILDVGTGLGLLGILLFFGTLWFAINRDFTSRSTSPQYLVAGAMIVVTLPILLSGFWNESPLLWAAVGLLSRDGSWSSPHSFIPEGSQLILRRKTRNRYFDRSR